MGRKDAARFIAIEKRLKVLEEKTSDMLNLQGFTAKAVQHDFRLLRDTLNKIIEE